MICLKYTFVTKGFSTLVYVCKIDINAAQCVKSTKSQILATISAHRDLKSFTAVRIDKLPLQIIQCDQKVSVHLMITIPPSGAQRLLITLYSVCVFYFYTSVNLRIYVCTRPVIGHLAVESAY